MNPEGEPSGTVTRETPEFSKPQPKSVFIEVKSTVLPVTGQTSWSWWATVDRHPWSDKRGYVSAGDAEGAARDWAQRNYPNRTVVVQGESS